MKNNDDWKHKLTPEEYKILREKGTEAPFTGKYIHEKAEGVYACAACGTPLFSSEDKFKSGTGWPSFTKPVDEKQIGTEKDASHGMSRTEILCKTCGGHLGHVFDDLPRRSQGKAGGPKELHGKPATGKRYCVNSAVLKLKNKK